MSDLQVDTLAGRVSGQQHRACRIVGEASLRLPPVFAGGTAVDHGHPERWHWQRDQPFLKIPEGVAVLGEHDDLASLPGRLEHLGVHEETCEGLPLTVYPGISHA